MAGKRNCSLLCAPQPIARFIQLFPKLALVFFLIHITVIIYSIFSPSPHALKAKNVPPGVVDNKIQSVEIQRDNRMDINLNDSAKLMLQSKNVGASKRNKTESILLKKLQAGGNQGNRAIEDINKPQNLQKRNQNR